MKKKKQEDTLKDEKQTNFGVYLNLLEVTAHKERRCNRAAPSKMFSNSKQNNGTIFHHLIRLPAFFLQKNKTSEKCTK